MLIDFTIVIIYLTAIVCTGLVASRKKIQNIKEFSLSRKKYGIFVLVSTLSAAFIGGGFSTGNAAKVAQIGIGNIFALYGFSVAVILIGKYVVPNIKSFKDVSSTGEIMGKCYGKNAQIFTGIFAFIVCAGILGAQISAISYIFNVFLGLEPLYGLLIGIFCVIISTSFGGMQSVVATEVIQFIILMIAMPLLLIFSVIKTGGISNIIAQIPQGHFNIFNKVGPLGLFSLFVSFAAGESMVPPYVQRLLMGKDLKTTSRATVISGILSFPFFMITGLIGLVGIVYFKNQNIDTNSVLQAMINSVAPIGIRGFLIAGTLSIVMSSASSFLNSASVELVNNVWIPIFDQKEVFHKSVLLVRLVNVLTGIIAAMFALLVPNVLDILVYSYSFWSPIILVPLLAALMGKKTIPIAFYISMISGIFAMLLGNFFLSPFNIDGSVIGIATNMITFCLATKFFSNGIAKEQSIIG